MAERFGDQLLRIQDMRLLRQYEADALAALLKWRDDASELLLECAAHIEGVTGAAPGSDSAELVARVKQLASIS
jgi:hypothetical protein